MEVIKSGKSEKLGKLQNYLDGERRYGKINIGFGFSVVGLPLDESESAIFGFRGCDNPLIVPFRVLLGVSEELSMGGRDVGVGGKGPVRRKKP